MLDISFLDNPSQTYAWGSRTAIPEFLGREPSTEPQAELWLGSHPKAPSRVSVGGRLIPLDQLIQRYTAQILGPGHETLPFLLKVLAAEEPLSIQAHPDPQQAAAGFAREEALGIPRSAFERNYRDANAKPELIYALTPFRMLRGFRPAGAIRRGFEALGILEDLPGADHLSASSPLALRAFFERYLPRTKAQKRALAPILARAVDGARQRENDAPEFACIVELARFYPGDPGILAPLFLHWLELEPGQAIYTGAGILHAYLHGVGIELMINSDNVLRGGLTPKHVDVPELMRVLEFQPTPPDLLQPVRFGRGDERFSAPDGSFVLGRIHVEADRPREVAAGRVEVLLCYEGRGVLTNPESGLELDFSRGTSLLVPASVGHYRIHGDARLFSATSGCGSRPENMAAILEASVTA